MSDCVTRHFMHQNPVWQTLHTVNKENLFLISPEEKKNYKVTFLQQSISLIFSQYIYAELMNLDLKGTVSWDGFQKFLPKFKELGLTKGRDWCLNFLEAPMIL